MDYCYLTKIKIDDQRPILEVRLLPQDVFGNLEVDLSLKNLRTYFDYSDKKEIFDSLFAVVENDPAEYYVNLEHMTPQRAAPYLIHTGWELPLMLDGTKPFSFFSDVASAPVIKETKEAFAPYVERGVIILKEDVKQLTMAGVQHNFIDLYYALPGEEWRFKIYSSLLQLRRKRTWNETCEKFEGMLFGYTDAQMKWWLDRRRGLISR